MAAGRMRFGGDGQVIGGDSGGGGDAAYASPGTSIAPPNPGVKTDDMVQHIKDMASGGAFQLVLGNCPQMPWGEGPGAMMQGFQLESATQTLNMTKPVASVTGQKR